MFDLNESIRQWKRSFRGKCSAEDLVELESHLFEYFEDLKSSGLSEENAFVNAAARIGCPDDVGREFAKVRSVGDWIQDRFSAQLTRPSKVSTAVKLMYASLVMVIIRGVFLFPILREPFYRSSLFINTIPIFTMWLFFIYMTGKGKNWARISILAIFIMWISNIIYGYLVSLPSRRTMFELFSGNPISSLSSFLQYCLTIAALILIFHNESSIWFRAIKELKKAKPVIK
jgi:hypothetical protein